MEGVGHIFSQLRKEIYQVVDVPIVQMEPTDFQIIEQQTAEYVEKFLFSLMPRKKAKVSIKALNCC